MVPVLVTTFPAKKRGNVQLSADQERDFHHPFTPYEIQKQFMNTVYKCLEEKKVGILESPTGQSCGLQTPKENEIVVLEVNINELD